MLMVGVERGSMRKTGKVPQGRYTKVTGRAGVEMGTGGAGRRNFVLTRSSCWFRNARWCLSESVMGGMEVWPGAGVRSYCWALLVFRALAGSRASVSPEKSPRSCPIKSWSRALCRVCRRDEFSFSHRVGWLPNLDGAAEAPCLANPRTLEGGTKGILLEPWSQKRSLLFGAG